MMNTMLSPCVIRIRWIRRRLIREGIRYRRNNKQQQAGGGLGDAQLKYQTPQKSGTGSQQQLRHFTPPSRLARIFGAWTRHIGPLQAPIEGQLRGP